MFDLTLIHPKLVHFTIALFTMSVFFEIVGAATKRGVWQKAAWLNILFAGAAAVATVISGLVAANNVGHNDAAHEIMETHETIGFIVLGIILFLLVWRIFLKGGPVQRLSWLYLLLGIGGVGLMVYGASLGGEMVYTHGVAVKAVPVSEAEAGHHHDHGDAGHHEPAIEPAHHNDETHDEMMQDSVGHDHDGHDQQNSDQTMDQTEEDGNSPDVHSHPDGSQHIHNH